MRLKQAIEIMESKINSQATLRPPRQRVALCDLRFFAYHGFYPEEQVLGNEYFVDVAVSFDYREPETDPAAVHNDPDSGLGADERQKADAPFGHTVNYEILYQLIREEMEIPRKLLETACYDIFERLQLNFPFLETITVRIRKSNPPFGGDAATAVVEIDWHR